MNISINNLGGSSPSVSSLISQLISKRTQSMNSLLDQKSAIESSLAQLQNGALSAGSINSSYSSQIASLQDTIDRLNEQYTINANKITTINSLKKSYSSTVSSLDSYIESLKNPNNAGKDLDIYLDGDKVSSNGNIGVTINNNSTGIQQIDLTVTQLATTSVLKSNVLTGGSVTLNTKLTDLFAGKYDSTSNKVTGTRDNLKENMKISDLGIKSGSFTIGSTKITIDADNDTLGSVMQKIRNAGYDVSIETVDYDDTGAAIGALSITGKDGKSVAITNQTTNFGSVVGLTVSEGNFTINGQSFNVTSTSTIGSLINEINYATADGVGAKFENGQLVFVASKTGEVDINVSKGTSNFTNAIGFTVGGVMNKDNLVMGTEGSYVTLTGLNDNVKLTDSVASGKFTEGSFTITHNKVDSNGTVLDEMVTTRIDVTSSDTVASIIEKIKSQTAFTYTDKDGKVVNGGLTAEIVDGKFRIRQLEKGADYHISVEAGSSTFTNYVGLTTSVSDGVAVSGNSSTLTGINNVTASTTFTAGNFKITASSAYDSSVLETKTIEVTAGESLSSVIDKINNSGLAVTASIQDNKLVLTHKNYGENFKISVEAGSSDFTEKVGFTKTTSVGTSNDGSVSYVLGNATGMSNSTSGFTSGSFTIKTNALSSDGKTASSNMLSATIEVSASDNLQSVMEKINNSGIGLTASIENGKLKISQVNGGEGFDIIIEAGDTNFTQKTGLTNSVSVAESSSSSSSYLLGSKVLPNGGFTAGSFTILTNKLSADGKSAEFEMLTATINVTTSDTRESIAQKITDAGIGLTATITSDGKIKIEQNNAGSDFEIKVEAGSTNFTEKAGLTTSVNNIGSLTPGKDVNQFTTLTGDKNVIGNEKVSKGTIKINGVDIDLYSGTLVSSIYTINSYASQTGVKAMIIDGKFVLQSTVTGSDTSIYVENGTSDFGVVSGLVSESTMGGTATIGSEGSKTTLTGSWDVTSSTQISEGTIKINGYNIVLKGGTLQSAIDTINSMSSQTGVTASIKDGKFVLTNVDSGNSTIIVEEGSSDIARLTGIASYQSMKGSSEVKSGTKTALVASKTGLSGSTSISNSSITINGQEILLAGTIDTAIAAINAKSAITGVEAYLDSDGRFVFANTKLGKAAIDLSFGYGDFGMKIGAKSSDIAQGDSVVISGGASIVGNNTVSESTSIDGVGSIWINTDPNTILIETADDFVKAMTGNTKGKTFVLANDIDLSGLTATQKNNLKSVTFEGHLNGNGYALSGYKYSDSSSTADIGLFNKINGTGVVENLVIKSFSINSNGAGGLLAGSIVNGATVRNVEIQDSTFIGSNGASGVGGVGALAGAVTSASNISNITITAVKVTGGNRTGGLIGTSWGDRSTIDHIVIKGGTKITGTYQSLNSFIVGESTYVTVSNTIISGASLNGSYQGTGTYVPSGYGANIVKDQAFVSLSGCSTLGDVVNLINTSRTDFMASIQDGHFVINRKDGSRDNFEFEYLGDGDFGVKTGLGNSSVFTSYGGYVSLDTQFGEDAEIVVNYNDLRYTVTVSKSETLEGFFDNLKNLMEYSGFSFSYSLEGPKFRQVRISTDLDSFSISSTNTDLLYRMGLLSFTKSSETNYSYSYESKSSILTGSVSGLNGYTVLDLDSVGEYRISGAKQDFILNIEENDTINSVIEKINSSEYYTAGLDSSGRFYIKAVEQDYVTEAEAKAQGYITVHNAQEFIDAVKSTAGVKVMLMADIDLSTVNFDGFDYVSGLVLDGNGFTIKNYSSSSALFGEIRNTTIRNVVLENFEVRNYTYAAALANKSYNSSVSTVLLRDSSLSGKYGIAGLIDNAYNTDISDSAVYDVSFSAGGGGNPDIGGFVRLLQAGSTITNSSLNHSTTYGVSPTTNNSVNLSSDFSSVNFDGSTVDLGSISEALGSTAFENRAENYNAFVVSDTAAFIDSTSKVENNSVFDSKDFYYDSCNLEHRFIIAGGFPNPPEYVSSELKHFFGFSDINYIYMFADSGSGKRFDKIVGLNGESYTGSYSTNIGTDSQVSAIGSQGGLKPSQTLDSLTNGYLTISQGVHLTEAEAISQGYYVAKTATDFVNLIQSSNSSTKIMLMNDIDLSTIDFDGFSNTFSGVLDGNGYTIKNFSSGDPNAEQSGALFKSLYGAVIKNLALENFNVGGKYGAAALAINASYSEIHSVLLRNSNIGSSYNGVAGLIDTAVRTNISDVAVIGVDLLSRIQGGDVGGIVRILKDTSSIENSSIIASSATYVEPTSKPVYGSIGNIEGSTYVESDVYVNGLAALTDSTSTIKNSNIFDCVGLGEENFEVDYNNTIKYNGVASSVNSYIASSLKYLLDDYQPFCSILITSGMTVQNIMDSINSSSDFTASLNSNGQLVITSSLNSQSEIVIGGSSNASSLLGFTQGLVDNPADLVSGKADEFSTLTGNASVNPNMTFTSGNFVIQVGDTTQEFEVYEGETLSSIMNKITQSDIDVSASIQNGKLVLTAKNSGTDRIYLIDGTSNFAELTGFVAEGGGQSGILDKGELATYTSQNTAQSAQNQGFSAGNFYVHLTDLDGNITDTAVINISENESIASIMDKINNSGLGVTASINDSGKMVITRNSSTTAGGVLVTKGSSDFTNKIGYTSGGFQSETTHRGQSTKLVSSNSIANSTRFTAGDFTIKLTGENDTEINIQITENDSIQSIIEKINSQNAGVTASLDSNNRLVLSRDIDTGDGTIQVIKGSSNFTNVAGFTTGGYQTASTVEGVTASITSTNTVSSSKRFTDGDFIINDVHINVSSTDSINDIVDKINASSAGVTASIVDNKLVLTRNADQGAGNIVIQKGSSNFTKEMGFTTGGDSVGKFDDGRSTSITSTSSAQTAMANGYTSGDFYIKWTDASGIDKSITVNIGNSGVNSSVDSVSKIIETINSQNAGVTASLDSSGKLVITRDESEGAGSLTIVKGTSDFTNVIGLTSGGSFNGVSEDGLAATYTVLTSDKLSVSNRATMASMGITSGSFLINGVEIAVNATDTIDDVIGRINTIFNDSKYKDIAVTAEFKNNQIVLTTKKASADARIDVESGSTNFTQVVGFTDIASRNNAVELGQNAKFNIKLGNDTVGKDFELALDLKDITPDGIYNGNNLIYLDINGNVVMEENNTAITIEVKKTGETIIKLGQNLLDASINELNKFVGSFNKAMIASENEILSDDAEFTKLINNIKSALTSDIADIRKVTQQLAKIGIVVDVRGGTDSNMGTVRLSVDREAYTKAFYDDSENVLNLLLGKETATGTAKGILTRLNDVLYPEVYNNSGYFNKTPRQLNAIQKELKREITSTTFDLNELKNSVSGTGSTSGLSEYLAQLEQQYQLIQEAIDNLNKQYATSMTRLVLNKNNSSFNPIVS